MVAFINLGPKHASKDDIGLSVFEVLGEFLLAVPVLGLRCAVLDSKLWLAVLLLVYSVGYDTQASTQSTQAHKIYQLSLRGNK
jgi:hypothetical protein